MNNNFDERIFELEKKITFLEDYLNQVNEVVIEQEKEINVLKYRIKEIELGIGGGAEGNANEKPPHY